MKRVFNKEKCFKDLKKLDSWIYKMSKGWVNMCDGREVINGCVSGNNGEKYIVDPDWTDVVDDAANTAYKEIFSRDVFIQDMGRDKGDSKWVIDCDGAEVINGYAIGKSGRKYCINDDWIKKVPINTVPVEKQKTTATDDWLREDKVEEPKKEVEKKTKQIFSKKKFLATGEHHFKWVDDCDGAEVIDGMATGKSGTEYYMCPEWVVEIPVSSDSYKIEIECNDDKATTATLYKNGEKINEATARCADEDTFDLFKGATLALNRLLL